MIYQYIPPSPALREYVRDYLIAHFVFNTREPIPVKAFAPRPEQAIAFLPKGSLLMQNLLTSQEQKAPAASICGQQVSRYNFSLPAEYLMFRINFQPGALFRLLGIPLCEFTDTWFDAESVINCEVHQVNEQLANSSTYAAMVTIVEAYLNRKIRQVKTDRHSLDKAVSYMFAHPSGFSLDWLANQACLCPRQFNRKFNERIGISPKLFSRIVRFFSAYTYKESHPQVDWLSVALLHGYTDYQHMFKDFKEFAHVSPSVWVQQDNQAPERQLHLA